MLLGILTVGTLVSVAVHSAMNTLHCSVSKKFTHNYDFHEWLITYRLCEMKTNFNNIWQKCM